MNNVNINGGVLGKVKHDLAYAFINKNYFGANILWNVKRTSDMDNINSYLVLSDTETYKIYQKVLTKINDETKYVLSNKEGYLTLSYNKDESNILNLIQEYKSHEDKEIYYIECNDNTENYIDIINVFIFSMNPSYVSKLNYNKLPNEDVYCFYITCKYHDLYRDKVKDKITILYNDDNKHISKYVCNNSEIFSLLLFVPTSIHEMLMHILDNLIYLNLDNIINILKEEYKDMYNIDINNSTLTYIDKYGETNYSYFQDNIVDILKSNYHKQIKSTRSILVNFEFGVLSSNSIDLIKYFSKWHDEQINILTKLFIDSFVPKFLICTNYKVNKNNNTYTHNTIDKNTYKNINPLDINKYFIDNIIKKYEDRETLDYIIKNVSIEIFKILYNDLHNLSRYKDKLFYIRNLSYN